MQKTKVTLESDQTLSNCDSVSVTPTSKYTMRLFNPAADVHKLLQHVVCGEYDAVQSILTENIRLIFNRGFVTDCSGREFKDISAFEYALWALDKHMWVMMLECIPENEESREIFDELIDQYNKVNTKGVTYELAEITRTEKHFDFKKTIIKELKIQLEYNKELQKLESIRTRDPMERKAIEKFRKDMLKKTNEQWREGVGGAQKLLPMHVVAEYCSNEPFYPVPEFTTRTQSLKQFYNSKMKTHQDWFDDNSKLGSDFAIYKGKSGRPTSRCDDTRWLLLWPLNKDLRAMTQLYTLRINDFAHLESKLKEKVTLDSHHQP